MLARSAAKAATAVLARPVAEVVPARLLAATAIFMPPRQRPATLQPAGEVAVPGRREVHELAALFPDGYGVVRCLARPEGASSTGLSTL